ncbi:MAG TPA: hypothetical protein VEI26_07005 [Terriglobales bacterium]|nr:hypothetical protein [Terriglobales bacterium]
MLRRRRQSSAFDDATKLLFVVGLAIAFILIWATVVSIGSFQVR